MLEIKNVNEVICAQAIAQLHSWQMDVYVFHTDGLLIDTGSVSLLPDLIPFFNSTSFDQVLLTHYHEDHSGGAKWIQENKDVPIYINPLSVDICSKGGEYKEYRRQIWGQREGFQTQPISNTFQSRTSKWEAIHTPGHSFDHMSYLNHSTGTLFSGDLLVSPKPKIIIDEEHLPTTIQSIKKILEYDFSEVYCSHKGYLPNGRELFQMKLDYLENLRGEILELYQKGLTAEEIKVILLPSQNPLIELSNNEWDPLHLITSLLDSVNLLCEK